MNTYYLTSQYKNISLTILIAWVVFIIAFLFYNVPCLLLALPIFAFLGFYTIWKKFKTEHIVLSENGIEYAASGFSVELTWDNIDRITNEWLFHFGQEGLIFKIENRIPILLFSKYADLLCLEFPQKVFIPISRFSKNWRNSKLGGQIKKYAPHLFQ